MIGAELFPKLEGPRAAKGGRAYAVLDANGARVNTAVLVEGVAWSPPEGCTVEPFDEWEKRTGGDPPPPEPAATDLKAAALAAIAKKQAEDALAVAVSDPYAPQAVKDYAASLGAKT